MKRKALVIGSHVSESLSPLIFNYWFNKYGIDGSYTFREIKSASFESEINKVLEDEELVGFNVTIPFKERIKEKIFSLDNHAKKIGAVNCVSMFNNKWVGKNTDWIGFYKSVDNKLDKKKAGKNKALVLGYGGASKAVLYALKKLGFKKISIYNRTSNKTKNLKEKDGFFTINYKDIYREVGAFDIIVNTTPTNVLKEEIKNSKQQLFGFDIVYNPKETRFLSLFNEKRRVYGISMLINQAAPCFEDWFGVMPLADEQLYKILEKKIN